MTTTTGGDEGGRTTRKYKRKIAHDDDRVDGDDGSRVDDDDGRRDPKKRGRMDDDNDDANLAFREYKHISEHPSRVLRFDFLSSHPSPTW